jgi:hypothetical protein
MADNDSRRPFNDGHVPVPETKGWIPAIRNGYKPETSEAGPPPTGGGGGKEPDKKD